MSTSLPVKKAVIPAAGLGTRFLPSTKTVPKELLPLFDKPLIQYAAEEAASAGISELVLVISPERESLLQFFEQNSSLEAILEKRGEDEMLAQIRQISSMVRVSHVIQESPLGLGHAILSARAAIGDAFFAVILPDDVIQDTKSTLSRMLEIHEELGSGIIAVEEIPSDMISSYGVITPEPISERVYKVRALVEKPSREKAPSNLAVVGRYILPPQIFNWLDKTPIGRNGEIQITDALSLLLEEKHIYAYRFPGKRYDSGTPLGLLQASLEIALQNPITRPAVQKMITNIRLQ